MRLRVLAVLATIATTVSGAGALAQSTAVADGAAYEHARPGLGEAALRRFVEGRSLFRSAWLVGPSADHPELAGLGPLHNRLSCGACHVKNGRAPAPAEGERIHNMVIRLGLAGRDAHGAPLPHPIYGGQFNPEGIVGVPGEGTVRMYWRETQATCGAQTHTLRKPELEFSDLAYGPFGDDLLTSLRNAPPVFGLGYLEAVPETAIRAVAAENGGRVNEVWDIRSGRMMLGRFGLKANQPSLRQQNANAFVEDLGITSPLFPQETCTEAETACRAARHPETVELDAARLFAVTAHVADLDVPSRRDAERADVRRGEVLFRSVGCVSCHRDSLPTADGPTIRPYTDLLLHDMGDGLADGRADFAAGPRDWRTPPLWGIGLARAVEPGATFLHDGRARDLTEAIVWHGGEAGPASEKFCALGDTDRAALLAFLSSL